MTAGNHARVGLLGSTSAEVIFSFYGLNMVGADVSLVPSYSVLTPEKLWNTITAEQLTDLIVTDDFAQPKLISDLFGQRKEWGLRNVVILHVPVAGATVHPTLRAAQEAKYLQLKLIYKSACMEHLLAAHADGPVNYTAEESCDTACILHTSGTTGGAGKPVPPLGRRAERHRHLLLRQRGPEPALGSSGDRRHRGPEQRLRSHRSGACTLCHGRYGGLRSGQRPEPLALQGHPRT